MRNYLFTLVALLLTMSLALAQRTITGIVVDARTKEPLIGSIILIPGTSTGTVADAKGEFSLTVPASATSVQVSFIGYDAQEVSIKSKNTVNVALVAGGQLAEVVVLGYTTARKQDLTGAVAIVAVAATKSTSSGNPMQALQGWVPGLYIEKTGTPSGNTDWQDVIHKNVGYLNNTGMLRYTGYNRLSGRINGLTSKLDGRFKLGVNLQLVSSREIPTATDLGGVCRVGGRLGERLLRGHSVQRFARQPEKSGYDWLNKQLGLCQ